MIIGSEMMKLPLTMKPLQCQKYMFWITLTNITTRALVITSTLTAHQLKNPDSDFTKKGTEEDIQGNSYMKENRAFPAMPQKAIQHSISEGISDKETWVIIAVQYKYKGKKRKELHSKMVKLHFQTCSSPKY